MKYSKILIKQLPRVMFAHGYKTQRYDFFFAPAAGMLEITYFEQGSAVRTYADGEKCFIEPPCVAVSFYDRAFSMKSDAPLHSHYTVGINFEYEKHPLTKEEVVSCSRGAVERTEKANLMAILPDCFVINQNNAEIKNLIMRIISAHSSHDSTKNLRCAGMLLDLLAEITEQSEREAISESCEGLSPGKIMYVRRAMQYITDNLSRKITIREIAGALNISESYLCNLFRSVTGQTIGGYITKVKLDKVAEMVATSRATLREAGESVGIYDENYLSRLFKKHKGITVREFREIKVRK